MTSYTPNFYDAFLKRYCRDKLACTLPCKPVNVCPGTDVKAVYPHINGALRHVYANRKVSDFNSAYEDLATYLEAYPEVVNKMNAILWRHLDKKGKKPQRFNCKSAKPCKSKHEFVDVDPDSYLPINVQNEVTHPGKANWCKKGCEVDECGEHEIVKCGNACWEGDHPCDKCGYEHAEHVDECGEYHPPKDCKEPCKQYCSYKDRCYCGEDELECEPRCGPKVEYEVPKPEPTCEYLPHSRSLKIDLTDCVPECLQYDRKLQELIARVVGYAL